MTTQPTTPTSPQTSAAARPAALDKDDLARLRSTLRGALITPGDAEYEAARRVNNAMIDRRPAAIVRCRDAGDVMSAVNFARQRGLAVAIRGGAHNPNGFATCDGGLVVDLGGMRAVRVDPERRLARADGGCTWGDYDHATHAFGLASTGGLVSTTGIGGLTLGGGIGHLARPFGLAIDNLVSADVVLADGRFVTASASTQPDLFWALRGGGGNYGVVTSFEFALHPVDIVLGGPVLYPLAKLREALRMYREYIARAPDEMNAFFAILKVPPGPPFPPELHDQVVCAVVACYVGALAEGERVAEPLRRFGPPALDLLGPLPYTAIQGMFDALTPPGLQQYWKADFANEISDAAIEVHAAYGPRIPTINSVMHIYPTSGAVQRVPRDATAYSYRDASFVHVIVAMHPDPADTPQNRAWVREYWDALHPYSAGGTYVNFMMDEPEARVRATYRDNYERLARIKQQLDPTNLFRLNQNIRPLK